MTDQTTPPAPTPGTPEYDAAMIAKADSANVKIEGQPAGEPPKPERPPHVPEKFWDAEKGVVDYEALAKSYTELESKLGKPEDKPADKKDEPPADNQQTPPTQQSAISKAADEYAKDGKLTDETFAELEKAGITRQYAEAYIEGLQARAELAATKLYSEAGGQESYTAMLQWAQSSLTPEQIDAFNTTITGGNLNTAVGAVRNLKMAYEAANGRMPSTRVEANSNNKGPAPEHFRSEAEVVKAMSDPRYKQDAAYRADVARKVEGSARLGVHLGVYGV